MLCQQSCDNHAARIWHKTYCTVCSLVRSADTAQPRKRSNVTRPFPILWVGSGDETKLLSDFGHFLRISIIRHEIPFPKDGCILPLKHRHSECMAATLANLHDPCIQRGHHPFVILDTYIALSTTYVHMYVHNFHFNTHIRMALGMKRCVLAV